MLSKHVFNDFFKSLNQQASKGFTLVEILIALTLLAIAGTFVAGKIFDQLRDGKISAAQIQMKALADRLQEYRRHCFTYPTTDQGLKALIEKPTGGKECTRYNPGGYIENGEIPVDPWDMEYIYESDGNTITIKSYGPDQVPGGEGPDEADIIHGKKN